MPRRSRRIQKDRLDDQTDDQAPSDKESDACPHRAPRPCRSRVGRPVAAGWSGAPLERPSHLASCSGREASPIGKPAPLESCPPSLRHEGRYCPPSRGMSV
jgi:hypothetical protein